MSPAQQEQKGHCVTGRTDEQSDSRISHVSVPLPSTGAQAFACSSTGSAFACPRISPQLKDALWALCTIHTWLIRDSRIP